MSIFSSLTQQYRSRFLTALRRGHRRRVTTEAAASESLEDRALLSAVSYNAVRQTAVFNADADDVNIVRVSSPDADTLVIRAQILAGGLFVDDPITLQGDAVGNPGFTLDGTGSELVIDITTAGSILDSMVINTFEEADQVLVRSTPQATSIDLNTGSGDDEITVGDGFRMDTIFGDVDFNGGLGTDSLDLMDFESTPSDTINLTDSSIEGMSPGDIGYSNLETLMIDTADRSPTTLNVLSTAAGTVTTADLTFEDATGIPVLATVTLGNTDANFGTSAGNMDGIVGELNLDTNSGTVTLQVDDSGDATGDSASISATTISGFSSGDINFTLSTDFTSFEVAAGTGDDTIDLSAADLGIDLDAGDGADQVTGSANDDSISGGAGSDTIMSGAGDDFVDGGEDDDLLDGESGDDLVLGSGGADSMFGGSGDDELSGDDDADTIDGGLGDDTVDGGDANDSLLGGDGNDSISGGEGNDVAKGNAGNDVLLGNEGRDSLLGNNGMDSITGGADIDRIRGGRGRDTITWRSGDGNDDVQGGGPFGANLGGVDRQIIIGTNASEAYDVGQQGFSTVVQFGGQMVRVGFGIEELQIHAAGGADTVDIGDLTSSSLERVVVRGGSGGDRVDGRNMLGAVGIFLGDGGADVLYGSDGNDTLRGGGGNDSLVGGGGDDSLKGNSGEDSFAWNAGDGSDRVEGGNADDTLVVTATNDANTFAITMGATGTLLNSPGMSTVSMHGISTLQIDTLAGPDTITVGDLTGTDLSNINADMAQGPDRFDASGMMVPVSVRVFGGLGNDELRGGPGHDFLRGAFDNDTLSGGGGNDELIGDEGEDWISGGNGRDVIDGGGDDDTLLGKEGSDSILGGGGNDRIEGDAGDDTIIAASGHDRITAGSGDDLVDGGNGGDTITGGEGDDVLIGGGGSDDIDGNGGQDLIVGGQTSLGDDALRQIRAEWLSGHLYQQRAKNISNIDGGKVINANNQDGTRLNGDKFLLPITSDKTVTDDEAVDTLSGNAGRDLFFADFDTDIVDDRVPSEMHIDLR